MQNKIFSLHALIADVQLIITLMRIIFGDKNGGILGRDKIRGGYGLVRFGLVWN